MKDTNGLIDRRAVINMIHKVIYDFFDVADDESEEPISEKDELLLEVNKAICNKVKNLPSAEPTISKKESEQTDWKTDHGYMWLCPSCGLAVHSDYDKCVRCGSERPATESDREEWIPVTWHEITEEERKAGGWPNDIVVLFDNIMPDDGEEILVTVRCRGGSRVCQDVCYYYDGFRLDSDRDWIDDIAAWMPLPKPYMENKGDEPSRGGGDRKRDREWLKAEAEKRLFNG